ncbi:hypothetical protein HHL22_11360 [Hymenobacter sp. RP-2-7]|uniref:TetR/AcrR family transcriptional regulator n=1 Tax=Hymenobacter polaris TaxID=2682546 RepID=A0A7Y0AEB0_9BACT|nr:hypothetical protein [Hymenobacter polaris]NML65801.1 hypothetical protein [Hymenobacter polaris]
MATATAPFLPTPPAATMVLLRQQGVAAPSETDLAQAENLPAAAFAARYPTRTELLRHALQLDLERQKLDHVRLYQVFPSAVERLFGLIGYSITDLAATSPQYLADLRQHAPAWELLQDHLAAYSSPQLQQLLNDGIRQGLFRSDINIQLVTIIIVQQLGIVLTPNIFPPMASSAEIFRSVFLYYIRGLCTDEGARQAAGHFARM